MNAKHSKALRIDKFRKWKHSLRIEHGIYTQADTLVCVEIKFLPFTSINTAGCMCSKKTKTKTKTKHSTCP